MAVSHQYKFIFVHIPKCAGSSIEKSFQTFTKLTLISGGGQNSLSKEYIEQNNLSITGNFHRLELHLSATEIKTLIGEKFFEECYKFSIVRNPFSRLVSYYLFIKRLKKPDMSKINVKLVWESSNFTDFVNSAIIEPQADLFFNQYKYIYDDCQNNLMNFTGRFENLAEDFDFIITQIQTKQAISGSRLSKLLSFLPVKFDNVPKLPHVNSSNSYDYREYYDEQLRKKVEQACEKDLQFFNYDF